MKECEKFISCLNCKNKIYKTEIDKHLQSYCKRGFGLLKEDPTAQGWSSYYLESLQNSPNPFLSKIK